MDLTPTQAQIVDVLSARYTATPGLIDLVVVVEGYPGETGPVQVPYTWDVNEEYDNSWNVAAWFAAHPDFAISPYVPPVPIPEVPANFPLTNRQLRLGLIRNGIGLSAVSAVIAAIPDPVARDEAQVWWEYTDMIHWDHAMTQTLIALMGIPVENASAMWLAAKDYAA